jgi:hypothetical protein
MDVDGMTDEQLEATIEAAKAARLQQKVAEAELKARHNARRHDPLSTKRNRTVIQERDRGRVERGLYASLSTDDHPWLILFVECRGDQAQLALSPDDAQQLMDVLVEYTKLVKPGEATK